MLRAINGCSIVKLNCVALVTQSMLTGCGFEDTCHDLSRGWRLAPFQQAGVTLVSDRAIVKPTFADSLNVSRNHDFILCIE